MLLFIFFTLLVTVHLDSSSCRDLNQSCTYLSALDQCNRTGQMAIMKFNCAETCSFCGVAVPCIDRIDGCALYLAQGLCTSDDPLRAEYACTKTCNFCSNPV